MTIPLRLRPRLAVDQLEARDVPAVSLTFSGGSLTLVGDNQNNNLTVTATAANQVQVLNGVGAGPQANMGTYALTGSLRVQMGNGADTVTLNLGANTLGGSVLIDAGNGNDSVSVVAAGGTLSGALALRGGLGNDTVNVNAGTGAAAGNFAGMVSVDGGLGADAVNLGNDAGVSRFGGSVLVSAANAVQWSTSQNDLYGGDVMFTPGTDGTALTMQEGAVGGSNLVTVAGSVRILGGAAGDTVFLRGMNIGGDLQGILGGGANKFTLSFSAASVTDVRGSLTYLGGSGSDTADLRGMVVNGSASVNTGDGDDEVDLESFGAQPTVVGGNLTVTAGNGNLTIGAVDAVVGGNVSFYLGNGSSTVDFTAASSIGGRLTFRSGSGATSLILEGAQTYLVDVNLGAGADTFTLNNAGAILTGRLDFGVDLDTDVFNQTAGTIGSPFTLVNYP